MFDVITFLLYDTFKRKSTKFTISIKLIEGNESHASHRQTNIYYYNLYLT